MSDPNLLLGTRYRLIGRLGKGTFGEVVEAEHHDLRHRVVIKLLHPEHAAAPEQRDRLRLEGEALAKIRHVNIGAVTDFGLTTDLRPYLVMEKLEGRGLDKELKSRGFVPVLEALDIAQQVLAALQVVHDVGMIHRDVKPANIFVCDAGPGAPRVMKLLDFGIAKVIETGRDPRTPKPLSDRTKTGTTLGTPRYMAPEQAAGDTHQVDGRVDVYAMGGVLYALIAGRGPFDHRKGVLNIVQAQLGEIPAPPSAYAPQPIPPELDAAIARALAKRPQDRFPTARAFADELGRISQALGTTSSSGIRLGKFGTVPMIDTRGLVAQAQAQARPPTESSPPAHMGSKFRETVKVPELMAQNMAQSLANRAAMTADPSTEDQSTLPRKQPSRWPARRILFYSLIALNVLLFSAIVRYLFVLAQR